MKFEVGHKKAKGRPKGSLNRDVQTLLVAMKVAHPGYEPLLDLADIATDPESPLADRLNATKELCKFLYPQRKPQEGPVDVADRLPPIDGKGGPGAYIRAVLDLVEAGELTLDQGERLTGIAMKHAEVIDLEDLKARVRELEEKRR